MAKPDAAHPALPLNGHSASSHDATNGFKTTATSSLDVKPPTQLVPHPSRSWATDVLKLLSYFLRVLLSYIDGSKWAAKSAFLMGNFAPVKDELFEQELEVVGSLPKSLSGAFARTGSNPFFDPIGRYHWFDGDGMVHAVRILNGTAAYCNRFVETARFLQERAAGYPVGGNFGDYRGGIVGILHIYLTQIKKKLGVYSDKYGWGTANTALAFHAKKLLALHEGDLPYALRIACNGLISTLGRVQFGGKMNHAFTAHPKVDPESGELFAYGYSLEKAPYLWYCRLGADGKLEADFPIPGLDQPAMMHDFALTERYVIFLQPPLFFEPEAIVKKKSLPFVFDKTKPLRIGVLDRYAKDGTGIKWFTLPSCMVFHVANAWDYEDQHGLTIELYFCSFEELDFEHMADRDTKNRQPYLDRVILNLKTGEASIHRISPLAGDFPVVPASVVGRRCRYAYIATMEDGPMKEPLFYGVAKIDLQASGPGTSVCGHIHHGTNRFGGEAYFVPASRNDNDESKGEDDGYLMTYVWDETQKRSELVIYNAATMSSAPVAVVKLPARVPFGFHSTWVTESQIRQQV